MTSLLKNSGFISNENQLNNNYSNNPNYINNFNNGSISGTAIVIPVEKTMTNLNQETNNNLFINGSIPTPHTYNVNLNNVTNQQQQQQQLSSMPYPTLNNSVGTNYMQINQFNNHNGIYMATPNVGYQNFSPSQNNNINTANNNIQTGTNNFLNSPQYASPVQTSVGYVGT